MTQTKEQTVHFRIDGADLTRIIRERLYDDAPGHAWRIATSLSSSNPNNREKGVADAALGVLNGTRKLVGNESDLRVLKERSNITKKHMERVREIYAGRIRIHDKWYVPVAYVTNCGPHDMKNDHGVPVQRLRYNLGYSGRAWHYAGKDEIVVDHVGYPDPTTPSIKREVIFRVCGERPHWMEVPLTPQAALDEFLATGHWIEERSHTKWYGADEGYGEKSERDDSQAVDRVVREQSELKKGNLGPMNARLNAELDLASELDEDDRPEVQALRNDPQRGIIERAWAAGPGVGVMAEMLAEHDPAALASIGPVTTYAQELEALREEARLAQEINDEGHREEAEEAIERDMEALRLRRLADLRVAVLKQAGNDLIDLSWPEAKREYSDTIVPGGAVKVPRAPFMHWAFARMKMYESQLPPWTTVCPTGMKMQLDDPNHTDWIVGAGLDPEDRTLLYYSAFAQAAMKLAHELQDKFDEPSDVHVLVDGPHASGTVFHGKKKKPSPAGAIVVLPNLHPDYLAAIEDAAAVITEEGGAVAHLAQVGRERNLPIVRIEGALQRFNPGDEVSIDTATRRVQGF